MKFQVRVDVQKKLRVLLFCSSSYRTHFTLGTYENKLNGVQIAMSYYADMKFSRDLISNVVLAISSLGALLNIFYPVTRGNMVSTRRFILSAQGQARCPDFWNARSVFMSRSHLECARSCAIWSECLHYSYQRNNGSCTLYTMTPANLFSAEDCNFMLVG